MSYAEKLECVKQSLKGFMMRIMMMVDLFRKKNNE